MADSGEGNIAVTDDEEQPQRSPAAASTDGGIISGSENDHDFDFRGNGDDSSDDEMLAHFLFNVCAPYITNRPQQRVNWVAKLLNGDETRFYSALRMGKPCFRALVGELTTRGRLADDAQTRLSVEETVAIFLRTVGHQAGHRQNGAPRFEHSTEIVSRAILQVLKALMRITHVYITLPDYANTQPRMLNDPGLYPYFKDVVGVVDGTLMSWVPEEERTRFRSHKGTLSDNVLAICDFNGEFTYVYAGWEGNASDARVLSNTILNDSHFPWPPEGKMYLVDAGFSNSECFLAPYGSIRNTGVHPTTPHELFNLRHSQLRNVVERCFGMLKCRFPILRYGMSRYSIPAQVNMVIACCVVHNFIRRFGMPDPIFDGNHDGDDADPTLHSIARDATRRTADDQNERRDAIADAMWRNRGVE